jgi:hypothetical protein
MQTDIVEVGNIYAAMDSTQYILFAVLYLLRTLDAHSKSPMLIGLYSNLHLNLTQRYSRELTLQS